MNFDDLSDELKETARLSKTPQEFVELAKREGLKLSDEVLDAVSGGTSWSGSDSSNECSRKYIES